jgi:hypothetical protein
MDNANKTMDNANTSNQMQGNLASSLQLPCQAWALVMEHLDFSSVSSLFDAYPWMNRDVTPLVTILHIDKSSQMHSSVARRFPRAKDIFIYSFLQREREDEEFDDYPEFVTRVDLDTTQRAVPFLVNFGNLRRVYFGYYNQEENTCYHFASRHYTLNTLEDEEKHSVKMLIDSISAAFRVGALPTSLEVKGLRCPGGGENCQVCRRACMSFPLTSVVSFGCGKGYPLGDIPNLKVCIRRSKLVRWKSLK